MSSDQEDQFFDRALIESALHLTTDQGWRNFSLIKAAHEAGLPIERVHQRFPFKAMVLLRLNHLADQAAFCGCDDNASIREHLFDLFMKRLDVFQEYRSGLQEVMRTLPRDPALAAILGTSTMNSLQWMADIAGLHHRGIKGIIRLQILLAIWSKTLHAWNRDTSTDLSETMQALDNSLKRAEKMGFLKSAVQHISPPSLQEGLPDHIPDLEA